MRNLIRRAVVCTVGVSLAVLAVAGPAWAAPVAQWRVYFTSPRGPSDLTEIAAIGPKNAWAAGTSGAGAYVVHWNGVRWRPVNVGPAGRDFVPDGIAATAANNVWIIGQRTQDGNQGALVWNGRNWRAMYLPSTYVAVLSSSDAWGYGNGGSCTGGSSPVCTSSVWHWHDGSVTSYLVPGDTDAIAAAGSHVWVLAQHAIKEPHGPRGRSSSLGAVYYGDASGLHLIRAPAGRMGVFPQLAASPGGQLWLLAPGLSARSLGSVDYWNGVRWARHVIPAGPNVNFGSWGFTYDDHQGVWLGPYLHWTGRRWIITNPSGPTQAFELMFVAPIPGSADAWAVGFNNARPGTSAYRGLIALFGPRP